MIMNRKKGKYTLSGQHKSLSNLIEVTPTHHPTPLIILERFLHLNNVVHIPQRRPVHLGLYSNLLTLNWNTE